ncbi:hypothetical protein [Vibrio sp. WXL210]|uniref:hypothetical protein n=1 Tax=Vibrio sp. WXL210 TaxID=3450709 RepID=UPI003EC939BB
MMFSSIRRTQGTLSREQLTVIEFAVTSQDDLNQTCERLQAEGFELGFVGVNSDRFMMEDNSKDRSIIFNLPNQRARLYQWRSTN